MSNILLVNTPLTEKLFLEFPVHLYKKDPNYIRPLDNDIKEVFDPQKNKAFRFGKAVRWILQDEKHITIGRIAAFVNKKYKNKGDDIAVGGMGFFECINNQAAANKLLHTAQQWLMLQGMEAMDGPINFGERDKWWGLVTKGFMQPLYCMNYNPPYYAALIENYGFLPFYHQVCFHTQPKATLDKKIWERHAMIANNENITARHINKNQLEKYILLNRSS